MEVNDSNLNESPIVSSKGVFQRFGRIIWRLFLFIAVVLLIFCIGIGFWFRNMYASIDATSASQTQLIQWFVFRNLDKESLETSEQLTDQYLKWINTNINSSDEIPYLNLMKAKIREYILEKPKNNIAVPERKSYQLQKYYFVLPRSRNQNYSSSFILADDIRPGSDLIQKLNSIQKSSNDSKPFIKIENNCRFVFKNWILKKMRQYSETPDEQKIAFLRKTVAELEKFQLFYNKLLRQLELPEAGELTLLNEFNQLLESLFIDYASGDQPDELAKLLWFKDLIVSTIAIDRAKLPSQWILRKAVYSSESQPLNPSFSIFAPLKNRSTGNDKPTRDNQPNPDESAVPIDFF